MAVTGTGSAVGNLRRVVVGFKSRDANKVTMASFVDCIVNYFNPNGVSAQLCCKLENNVLILSPSPDSCQLQHQQTVENNVHVPVHEVVPSYATECPLVTLEHSPFCPLSHLEEPSDVIPPEKLNQGIHVAVAMILESSDEHILVTQRADHMRTFPRAWVPPGGHIDVGETLIQGGMRELEEETGLSLKVLPHQTHLLCLWESVYPPFLGMGNPRNHHIVVYIHTKVEKTWNELQSRIKLDEEEVQGCVWLSRENIAAICSGDKDPVLVEKYVVGPDGRLTSEPMDLSRFFRVNIPGQRFSGLQAALNKWLQVKAQNVKRPCKM